MPGTLELRRRRILVANRQSTTRCGGGKGPTFDVISHSRPDSYRTPMSAVETHEPLTAKKRDTVRKRASKWKLGVAIVAVILLAGVARFGIKYLLSKPIGGSCHDATYCRGSYCIKPQYSTFSETGYCTGSCQTTSDCPAHYECRDVQREQRSAPTVRKLCVRRKMP